MNGNQIYYDTLLTATQSADKNALKAHCFDTPIGPMFAVANAQALLLLEFVEKKKLAYELECLQNRMTGGIIPGSNKPIESIQSELKDYFTGKLNSFTTPIQLSGSSFQRTVWNTLKNIPYGHTWSYLELAKSIDKPNAFRAVGMANGANQLSIVIPCHRVINANGQLGGYAGGLSRKEWLLTHEKQNRITG